MNLKITIIQSTLHWENVTENLNMFSAKIDLVAGVTDIIVLPEMFNTGFSMKSEMLAETMDDKTVNWMINQAKKANAVIVGSLIIKEETSPLEGRLRGVKYFNRLVWMQPNGDYYTYDKRHLFRMAGEHDHFSAGQQRIIINYKGFKICPLICYDLRFPVWSRNKPIPNPSQREGSNSPFGGVEGSSAYDCLIYIANWPAARKAPWSKLLEARAIENQCYVVGVNRVGSDGKEIAYSGNSVVVNPKGEAISTISDNEETTQTITISLNELNDFRKAFPVGLDADEFEVTL
jgi:predicted amidohydrolase